MICENVYTNVELWDMGAQLCLSNNYENFSNDYKVLEHGNMVAANGAEEKILGVGTKTFSDGLDIKGTIHVPDASASLLAVGHVLAMKEGSYIKIDKKGLYYFHSPEGSHIFYPVVDGLYPLRPIQQICEQNGLQFSAAKLGGDRDSISLAGLEEGLLDTACTQHSVPEEVISGWESDYELVEGETLCVANGSELQVIGRGSRQICANPPIIQKFIHVRGLQKILISVSQLIREYDNLELYVYAFGCILQFPDNVTVNL
jgi:hypothetical protein